MKTARDPSPFRAKLFSQRGYLTPTLTPSYSAVEQWPARWAHNPKVGGSNPPSATNFKIKVMKEHLVELMLANTSFTEEEIGEMDNWEIQMHLGYE